MTDTTTIHGDGRRQTLAPTGERLGAAQAPRLEHVEQLAAMIAYLHALEGEYRTDHRLNERFRDVKVRLQDLVDALSSPTVLDDGHASTTGASPDGAAPGASLQDLEAVFLRWLVDPVDADGLRVDGDDRSPRPLRQVMDALAVSHRSLPPEVADRFGLASGTTVGRVATELRRAVEDPDGPRCRSYRSAAYYLRGLDRLILPAEVEEVVR